MKRFFISTVMTLSRVILAQLILAVILLGARAMAQNIRLAATPPMGWNTWYPFGCKVSER
ncbi:MAG: hypothetical protein ACRD3O_21265 [Terriglobia bacterium]